MGLLRNSLAALGRGFGALMPTCRQAARLQSDELERPLRLAEKAGLRFHLLLCRMCRRYGHQIRFLCRAVHEHSEEFTDAAPNKLSNAARERIKEKLRNEPS